MQDPKIAKPVAASIAGSGSRLHPLSQLLRDPLIHFLLIGAAVFGLYALIAPPPLPAQSEIVITSADAGRLKAQFRSTWSREPTPAEFDGLLENLIREEVFYREAKLFGLDQNDQVIRLRLRQKSEYLLSQPAAVAAPSEVQLRAHYEETKFKFAAPSSISFQQVYLGDASQDDFQRVLDALKAGADAATLGATTLLPSTMQSAQQAGVESTFGKGFFATLAALPLGDWTGPVRSSYGHYIVRVTAVSRPETPSFEKMRAQVEADWRLREGERAKEAAYQALKARYRIDVSQIVPPA
jgi:hypothetical protein